MLNWTHADNNGEVLNILGWDSLHGIKCVFHIPIPFRDWSLTGLKWYIDSEGLVG